jgi:hypothetical protein
LFAKQFKVRITNFAGKTKDTAGVIKIEYKKTLVFRVKNTGEKPAYLHLYNLDPKWHIKALTAQYGGYNYLVIPKRSDCSLGFLKNEIDMTIPDSFINRDQY